MANILIAIVTLAIGFLLVSYGAYSNYYSTQRTFVASVVGRALERQMIYIDMSKSDLGRFPSVSDLDSNRFTKENRDGIVFTYGTRSEEHTSELQSLMRISYAVFCLQKKTHIHKHETNQIRDIHATITKK